MWLVTQLGFFSVAEDEDDRYDGTVTIAALTQDDLETLRSELLPGVRIQAADQGKGYRFQATCPRDELELALEGLLDGVDYESLGERILQLYGVERHAFYSEMLGLLDKALKSTEGPQGTVAKMSYGGVLVDHKRGVLLRKPSKELDGYAWPFYQGPQKKGKSPEEAALYHTRSKTGYQAEILARLPGKFEGGHSTAGYFLMRPLGEAGAFSESKTERTQWVPFDEAHRLLGETQNQVGLERDQALLRTTKRLLERVATSVGWDLQEMPERSVQIPLQMRFSRSEMTRLRRGHMPQDMDDRWYVFFHKDWVNFHRSWTGFCVFRIRLESDGDCFRVAACWVNRDPEQYTNQDPKEDQRQIVRMLFSLFRVGSEPWQE